MIKDLLEKAHYECCKRENVSSGVLLNAYIASGSTSQAIAAAISCFGSLHAPVDEALALLNHSDPKRLVKFNLKFLRKVPGWGSQFVKGKGDSIFNEVANELYVNHGEIEDIIFYITCILHQNGKKIYPNAACYTAAVGKVLGYTVNTIHFLLIECRLRGWLETIKQYDETGSVFFKPQLQEKDQTSVLSS